MFALYVHPTVPPICLQTFFLLDQFVFSELVQRKISDFSLKIYYHVYRIEICYFQRNKLEKNEL